MNLMGHSERKDLNTFDRFLPLWLQDVEHRWGEFPGLWTVAKHNPGESPYPLLCSRRACYMQRFVARVFVEVFQKKEREPAVVISMEMTYKDGIQPARIKPCSLHRQQGCRAAVQKKKAVAGLYEVGAMVSPTATEGITATYKVDLHAL